MLKLCVLVFCLVVVVACSPLASEVAGIRPDNADAETTAPTGAEGEILAWARKRHGPQVYTPMPMFFGDFTGDGVVDALAWVRYPSGGNSDSLDVALFRNNNGRMVYARSADGVFGTDPRNVMFSPGRITLTSTMPKPGDPRCCPTGSKDWTIDTR